MNKKILAGISLILSNFIFADFLGDIQKIDKYIQNKNYKEAIKLGENLLKTDLSNSDKNILNVILDEVRAKIPMDDIKSQTEIIIENTKNSIEENIITPIVEKGTRLKFKEYENYEMKILETGNSVAINDFSKWYIEHGLYEKAMNLALQDPNRTTENIYLAATAARMIGQYDKSISLYNEVLEYNPNHYKTFLGLAMAYKLKGHFKIAASYLIKYQQFNNSPEIERQINKLQTLE